MQEKVIRFLEDKSNYPDRTRIVEHKQTHISHVFLTDSYAYKIKKPVDFGFLDFSTLERRKHFCEREVELNRRLAPELYLGVDKITRNKGGDGFEFNGDGEVVEYAVRMKRMPEGSIMTELVKQDKVDEKTLKRLARKIADFHMHQGRHQESMEDADECGMRSTKNAAEQNFEQTEKYVGKYFDRKKFDYIREATGQFFIGKKELFDARIKNRKIIEFHGDLHTGNVFIDGKDIHIFDCIEFNKEFACGDVVSDIAFMAMDLDFLGREDLSKYLVRKYIELTGDHLVYALLNFFKCYRAYVRAKVSCLMLDDPRIPAERKQELESDVRRYFWLALEYARHFSSHKPVLMISCGLSGTGKSRWLKFAADILGGTILRTDRIRRRLFSLSGDEKKTDEFKKKYYSEKARQKVYGAIKRKAEKILSLGGNVAVDATFIKKGNREAMRQLAESKGADFLIIYTQCSDETVQRRIEKRNKEKDNISDADFSVFKQQRESFDEPGVDENVIALSTELPVKKNLEYLNREIERRLGIEKIV